MGKKLSLNDNWIYSRKDHNIWEKVRIPHTNVEMPYHYFDENIYQFESVYERKIMVEKQWENHKVLLTFLGVAHFAKVYVGDTLVGEHAGGYTAFTLDITSFVVYGEENILRVEVDSRESLNIPPFGNVIDYLTYGGIYREVFLEIKENTHIQDVFVETSHVEKEEKKLIIHMEVSGDVEGCDCEIAMKKTDDTIWRVIKKSYAVEKNSVKISGKLKNISLWTLENPALYYLRVVIKREDKELDAKEVRFGFRECDFRKDGFYLNHEKITIMGLNRHQSFPYVGYAMPKRTQRQDADILKKELGVNAVRTSHYPQSQHFIDRCDELGLLVFTEIPGWQHIGNEDWKDCAVSHAKEMVMQYRNHPSIILWGARINESMDDDLFYNETNEVIHGLDSTRQTGGVRCIKKSSLLEDVYTYNDFSHTGKNDGLEHRSKILDNKNVPYLVTEYNGHMFPTKSFDEESHRCAHALCHAKVVDSIFGSEDLAGGFGWCMFDYNTHKDFGSGDHICHHGVMNMFRVPKMAASVYTSQNDEMDSLTISSTMDIGEHPGGNLGTVYGFTNGDYIKLYKNNEFIKDFYPDRKTFPNMPHPPIIIDDFIGELLEKKEHISHANAEAIKEVMKAVVKYGQHNLPISYKLKMAKVMLAEKLTMEDGMKFFYNYVSNWGGQATTYRFEAIKEDKVIASVEKSAVQKVFIKAIADTNVLVEDDTYDVASIRIEIVDEQGVMVPYYQEALSLEVEGCISIIGPKTIMVLGGGGTYVKTRGTVGEGMLTIRGNQLEPVQLIFTVRDK